MEAPKNVQKIDEFRPLEIYRESDQKVMAKFPNGLMSKQGGKVEYEYDHVFKPMWAAIEHEQGVRVSPNGRKRFSVKDDFVPINHKYFGVAFFQEFYQASIYSTQFKWRYIDAK